VGIGVRERASGWGCAKAEVVEFAAGHAKSVGYLSQAFALRHLAKQHGYALIPAREALGPFASFCLKNQAGEVIFIDDL